MVLHSALRGPRLVCLLLCFTTHFFAFAGARADTNAAADGSGEKLVVASTAWVAALAEAAGARNVRVLDPVELRHPPEYELKPSDLSLVSRADFVFYAGWERFAEKLAETAGSASVRLVKVSADCNPPSIYAEAEKIAALLGTTERFAEWRTRFDALANELRDEALLAWPDRRALVHRMQKPFVSWLGFDIIGEFGPAEPSPALILELVRLGPALLIDNYHGALGQPIAEAGRLKRAELIFFPGRDGSKTLEDLFRYNVRAVTEAAR